MSKEIDITSEEYRIYTFADGKTFRIDSPAKLFVVDGNSHRVVDTDGVTHRPSHGYVGISWKPREGQPAFVA